MRANLLKDTVHDGCGEQYLPIRDGDRRTFRYGAVEQSNQPAHAGFGVEVTGEEAPCVGDEVCQMLAGENGRRYKLLQVTLVLSPAKLQQDFMILIQEEPVLWAIY